MKSILKNFPTRSFSKIAHVPNLKDFLSSNTIYDPSKPSELNLPSSFPTLSLKYHLQTYGCQMNENDSEIIRSILNSANYSETSDLEEADLILTNTCAIRESAEQKILNQLTHIKGMKRRNPDLIYCLLGCMAERLKSKLFSPDSGVDIIAGPDSYRDLPQLVNVISSKSARFAQSVQLSIDETYADVAPTRKSGLKAYVSIMRGCNNMCSFCIVPFVRGKERSRSYLTIEDEVKSLRDQGIKEITLLGQNVNSYSFENSDIVSSHENTQGFTELYKTRDKPALRFGQLLSRVAEIAPDIRFRFTSPHPKDFPDSVLDVIASYPNVCKQIHLPIQSGSSKVLLSMRRYHTKEDYYRLVDKIREKIPHVALSSDFIVGFCGETEEDFNETLEVSEQVKFDLNFMFKYSMRDKTHAYHRMVDDVSNEEKQRRLEKLIEIARKGQDFRNKMDVGKYHLVLVESGGKNEGKIKGRTDTNKICVFDETFKQVGENKGEKIEIGDYVIIKVNGSSTSTLFGEPIMKTTMSQFYEKSKNKAIMDKI